MQRFSAIATWVVVVLAVVAFAVAGYVITRTDPVKHAGRVLSVSASPSTPATSPTAASSSTASQGTVAFLGDDWTAGIGASPRSNRFSTLVAASLQLRQRNFGVTGTGYAKSSRTAGNYLSRVPAVVASAPDVVVVSGGRNDTSDDMSTLTTAADSLFTSLRRKLPEAMIVAVAPMWGDSAKPAALAPVAAAVRRAVTSAGGHYLAVADPILGHSHYMSDGADPNNAGYAAIAAALTPRIRALLPA